MEQSNLPELRDIHLPEADISWFPIAYGWWVILAVILFLFFAGELFLFWRKKSKKIYALKLLNKIENSHIISAAREMSEILRRICLVKYPQAAGLYNKNWIDFLNSHCQKPIEDKAGKLLIYSPYVSENSKDFNQDDLENLKNFCQNWIGENL